MHSFLVEVHQLAEHLGAWLLSLGMFDQKLRVGELQDCIIADFEVLFVRETGV